MSTLETLQAARDLLDANEWCQGRYTRPCEDDPDKTGFCALGALIHSNIGGRGYSAARLALLEALPLDDSPRQHVAEWNDTPGRTKNEVLALYDRAIGAERGKL